MGRCNLTHSSCVKTRSRFRGHTEHLLNVYPSLRKRESSSWVGRKGIALQKSIKTSNARPARGRRRSATEETEKDYPEKEPPLSKQQKYEVKLERHRKRKKISPKVGRVRRRGLPADKLSCVELKRFLQSTFSIHNN